jgi:hypothetical protein
MRLGLELSYSGDPATGSVTVTKKLWAECYYRIDDVSNATNIAGTGGTYSGAESYEFTANYQQLLIWTGTSTETVVYGSTTTKSASASASGIDYIGSSVTVSVSASIVLPARPYTAPTAPTIGTNTRNSDTSNTVGWTNNSTTAAPYTNLYVERQADGGAWVQVASLAGSATSYTDTTTAANHGYAYRVRVSNSAGSATSAASSTTYNTPAAPSGCAAVKTGASAVDVSWTDESATETAFEIDRTADAGETWTNAGSVGEGVTAFSDASAPGGTVAYRVRATRSALASAYSATSNSVATITPPAAPTLAVWPAYSPTGTALRVSWQHNPLDGSAQSAADVVYTIDGVETTDTTTIEDATAYYDIPITGVLATKVVTVKVRTYGLDPTAGPYSATQSTTLADTPQAAITTPATDATVVTATPLGVEWSYTDEFAQAGWTLRLYEGEVLKGTWAGTTETSQSVAASFLSDAGSFSLVLEARSGSGFTVTAERDFTTDYDPPTVPEVYASFDEDTLAVTVSVVAGATGALPPTDHLEIWRVETSDGASETSIVVDDAESGSLVTDRTPRLGQGVTYRGVAFASNGAYSTADIVIDTSSSGRFAVNFGDGDGELVVLAENPARLRPATDDSETLVFAGRSRPVVYTGEHTLQTIEFSADTRDAATLTALASLAQWRKAAVWRACDGERQRVKVTRIAATDDHSAVTRVALSMTVVE